MRFYCIPRILSTIGGTPICPWSDGEIVLKLYAVPTSLGLSMKTLRTISTRRSWETVRSLEIWQRVLALLILSLLQGCILETLLDNIFKLFSYKWRFRIYWLWKLLINKYKIKDKLTFAWRLPTNLRSKHWLCFSILSPSLFGLQYFAFSSSTLVLTNLPLVSLMVA